MSQNVDDKSTDRRAFLKAAAYVAPVVMTLTAKTAYASLGSSRPPQGGGPPTGRGRGPASNVQWEDEWIGGNNGRGRGRGRN